ncbi:MAG: hypothetical protein IKD15_02450, partial [Clostridia bacterium]|nr:hypothetical protein [Clostridia bacterium]
FCMICDEPKDGVIDLIATNDLQVTQSASYTVENLVTGETLCSGECSLDANGIAKVASLPEIKGGFYLIRWKTEQAEGVNHFVCNIGEGWTYEQYKACMEKAGFYNEFEGF